MFISSSRTASLGSESETVLSQDEHIKRLERQLHDSHVRIGTLVRDRDTLVTLLNRIALEGCGIPFSDKQIARTAEEWCGRGPGERRLTNDQFEAWLEKMYRQGADGHR